jgi:NAD(P)-dependent dehydrogenase (short-subunit alcohol dehydrogenase family)
MLRIDLSGNTALVTGATGELGRVITRTLAQCGADVAIHYWRHEDQAAALLADIEAAARVELTLPETGVCRTQPSSSGAFYPLTLVGANACCGGPAPAESEACCAQGAEAKAAGQAGCGCGAKKTGASGLGAKASV